MDCGSNFTKRKGEIDRLTNMLRNHKIYLFQCLWVMVLLYPYKMNIFGDILESAFLSICVSVCLQTTHFCQRAGAGIRSHSVTALVFCSYLFFSVLK